MLATLLASLPALRNGVGSGLTPLRSPSSTARAATPVMQYGGDAMSQSGQYGQQGYGQQGMPNMPLPPASQRYAAPSPCRSCTLPIVLQLLSKKRG